MKYKFTTSAFFLLVAFLLLGFTSKNKVTRDTNPVIAQQKDDGTPYLVKEFNVNAPIRLTVRTSGGYITVKSRYSDKVRVEMYVRRHGHELTKKDTDLGDYNIDISKSGNEVRAIDQSKSRVHCGFWNGYSISFVVYTPRKCDCNIKTSGGHIDLADLEGQMDASTSGGHIDANDITGNASLRTSGGSIKITHQDGEMDARTSGGHIEVDGGNGTLRLSTSGGHISLDGVAGEIDARTSGGSIRANVLNIKNRLSLRTSGGGITANIPGNQGYDLDLSGSSVHTNLKDFSGSMRHNSVEGTVKGGGPKVILRTSGGSIRLNEN